MKKLIGFVSLLVLAGCSGSDDIHLCDDPNGCTVTPTHPPIDTGTDFGRAPQPTKVHLADASTSDACDDSGKCWQIIPVCHIADPNMTPPVPQDVACGYYPASGQESWVYWPSGTSYPNDPSVPCNANAVQPLPGEQCLTNLSPMLGVVHFIPALL